MATTTVTPARRIPGRQHRFDGIRTYLARRPIVPLTLLAVVFAAMAWLRIPSIARDTLWAEDGRNFLQDAVNHGPLASLAFPYAGYLHTIPRIIASITVTIAPVQFWAEAMTAGSCIVAGILAAIVFVCTRDVVPWLPARVVIASLTVLAPLAAREVLGNAANVHSLVLWAVFWMLLYRPRTRVGSIALGVVAVLGAATEIQCLLLLPLVLVHRRDRMRWPMYAGLALGLAAQLFTTLVWPRAHTGNPADSPLSIVYGYLINAAMPLAMPENAIGPVFIATGALVGFAVVAIATASAVYVFIRGRGLHRIAAIGLLFGSFGFYAFDIVNNPQSFYDYAKFSTEQMRTVWLVRYGVVPSMMLAAVVLLAIALAVSRAASRIASLAASPVEPPTALRPPVNRTRIAAYLASALVAAMLLAQFVPQETRRSYGPQWSPQVASAARACEGMPADHVVAIAETITWHVFLTCSTLDSAGG